MKHNTTHQTMTSESDQHSGSARLGKIRRLLLSTLAAAIGVTGVVGLTATSPASAATTVADGHFVQTPDGRTYRIVGSAPIWVSDYGKALTACWGEIGFANCTPTQVSNLGGYRSTPTDGTILRAIETGQLYKVAGGAAVYLTRCGPAGVCDSNGWSVNQASIDGNGGFDAQHQHLYSNVQGGTILRAPETGAVYEVAGGAPLHLTSCTAGDYNFCSWPMVQVNQLSIDRLGADPRPGSAQRLRPIPDDGTLLLAVDTGRRYVVVGGAPLYPTRFPSCSELCPWFPITEGTITALDHMNNLPVNAGPSNHTNIKTASGPKWFLGPISSTDPRQAWQSTAYDSGLVLEDNFAQRLTTSDPFGNLDQASYSNGTLSIAGWVTDPNVVSSIDYRVTVDGAVLPFTMHAGWSRPDLRWAFSAYGNNHGFNQAITMGLVAGPHQVCVIGINTRQGSDRGIGCRNLFLL